MRANRVKTLKNIFDKTIASNQIHECVLFVENTNGDFSYRNGYGGGYMQIPLDGLNTLFMGKGELIGHSGSTGSFAFYYPLKDLFIVGDVNQMANPAIPIRLIIKLAMIIK